MTCARAEPAIDPAAASRRGPWPTADHHGPPGERRARPRRRRAPIALVPTTPSMDSGGVVAQRRRTARGQVAWASCCTSATGWRRVAYTLCDKVRYHSMSTPEIPGAALVPLPTAPAALEGRYPAILERAGAGACFAAGEFFGARHRNPHTRRAYGRAVSRFLDWCDAQPVELRAVTPLLAGHYMDSLGGSPSTQKLALAALRQFGNLLVTRHALTLNPFLSVTGPRQARGPGTGRTPEITVAQTRTLLASIDCARPVGLRDRAVLGTLAYTGARVGALAQLRLQDLCDAGESRTLRFREKRGQDREIPVRLDLDHWLTEYLAAAGVTGDAKDAPLFRAASASAPTGLSRAGIGPWTIRAMLHRRLKDAGLPTRITPHSFRVMVVTDLLTQGVPLDDVQFLAGHAHPSTTQVYDRRHHRVTRNIVERISV